MITLSIPNLIALLLLVFILGVIFGISATFDKLHRRFGVPWHEMIWDKLTLRSDDSHRPYKVIIAGTYGQFQSWVQTHIINLHHENVLRGRDSSEVEAIRVGTWENNPVVRDADLAPDWWEVLLSGPVY